MSTKRMLGWEPSYEVQPLEGGGWRITQTEAEWDDTERNLALATDLIDEQRCPGCGGDLSVNLTDKPPYEDDGDGHYLRFKPHWCRECVARAKLEARLSEQEKDLAGTPADPFPRARFFAAERLPIPKQ